MPLRHMIDIVAKCIVLHNICVISKDKFDMKWIEEVEKR